MDQEMGPTKGKSAARVKEDADEATQLDSKSGSRSHGVLRACVLAESGNSRPGIDEVTDGHRRRQQRHAKTSKDEDKDENAEQDKAKQDDTDLSNFNNSLRGLIE